MTIRRRIRALMDCIPEASRQQVLTIRQAGGHPKPTDVTVNLPDGRLMRYYTDGSLRHNRVLEEPRFDDDGSAQ